MPADFPVGRLLRPTLWQFANDYISFITRPWSPYVTYSSFFLSISLAFVWGCRALCVFDVVAARVWCCLMGHTQARSVFPTAFGSLSASDFRALILRRSTYILHLYQPLRITSVITSSHSLQSIHRVLLVMLIVRNLAVSSKILLQSFRSQIMLY